MADSHRTIDIDGRAVALRLRKNKRARRLILRLDETGEGAVVTLPPGASVRDGVAMAQRQSAWLAAQFKRKPLPVPFEDGAQIPYLDEPHTIRHCPEGRGIVREGGEIWVSGRPEHLSRRLHDWLKDKSRHHLADRVQFYGRQLEILQQKPVFDAKTPISCAKSSETGPWPLPGKHVQGADLRNQPTDGVAGGALAIGRIGVRDTRSRWGSCGPGGLNFSWRLIFAPPGVVDYVVAHEVAHLVHRDHGPAFWALTRELAPHLETAKAWLNTQGRTLHRYGAPCP